MTHRYRNINIQNQSNTVDLHGLTVREAVKCADQFLDGQKQQMNLNAEKYKRVTIITGRGAHSANGIVKIKCTVETLLVERKLKYSTIRGDGGFEVLISSKGTRT